MTRADRRRLLLIYAAGLPLFLCGAWLAGAPGNALWVDVLVYAVACVTAWRMFR